MWPPLATLSATLSTASSGDSSQKKHNEKEYPTDFNSVSHETKDLAARVVSKAKFSFFEASSFYGGLGKLVKPISDGTEFLAASGEQVM